MKLRYSDYVLLVAVLLLYGIWGWAQNTDALVVGSGTLLLYLFIRLFDGC